MPFTIGKFPWNLALASGLASTLTVPISASFAMVPASASRLRTAPYPSDLARGDSAALPYRSELAGARAVAKPNTDLKKSGSKVTFDPSKLTVPKSTGKTCTTTHYSFSITNDTKVNQQVKADGKTFGKAIPPRYQLDVCGYTSGRGVFTLASSAGAKLSVTVS